MVQPKFQPLHITTATTAVMATSGNVTVHSVNFPKATTGTLTLQSGTGGSIMVFPIGSIGAMILDAVYPSGLQAVTSAEDSVVITYQIP